MVQLKDFVFDNSLITAFVGHWRLKTHTFHLPWGSAPSPCRTLRTTSSYAHTGSQWVGACVTSKLASNVW
ncbi:hypothetical protein AHAS_Ahas18G0095800 [Arachis hypogaea]